MPQSLAKLWVHIIFSTKDRYPFLCDITIQKQMHAYIKGICYQQKCYTAIVGGTADHVHLLTYLHKNISASVLIEEIKKSSSKWIKTIDTQDRMLKKFYWQSGYGAFSVSQSNIEQVQTYIENQFTHHQKYSFQDEFRKILLQHEISYEEKYLWG